MNNYHTRFIVIFVLCLIGATIICFSVWNATTNSIPAQTNFSHKQVIHSAENNSPYSVLEGTVVRIKPYNATFEIPESWLTPKPAPDKHIKNLFFSWQELNEVNQIDGEVNGFNMEEAQVINSIFAFEDCVAHIGDKGWGNGLWNDLQGRVYVTNLTLEEIKTKIEKQGLGKATEVFERASLKSDSYGKWQKLTLNVLDAPSWSDFMLGEDLDFYYRSFDGKTVIIVFLHTDKFEEEISLILNSFKWSKENISVSN